MEKTYSQKVAECFKIAGYVFLIPTIPLVVLANLLLIFVPPISILVDILFIVGCVLLSGYRRHAAGDLTREQIKSLWLATAVYNFILMLPCLYGASYVLQSGFEDEEGKANAVGYVLFILVLPIIFCYMTAIVVAIKAYFFEKDGRRPAARNFPVNSIGSNNVNG